MVAARKCRRCWPYVLFFLFALAWLPGLAWFYQQVPVEGDYPEPEVQTDAIVVLTGGMGRVEHGLEQLRNGRSKVLLISGVDPEVRPEEMIAEYGIDTSHPALANDKARMVLDYGPRDTVGNARDTARWMDENGFHSLRLVTSGYHMPRSLLEFRHAMPGKNILPSPAFPQWDALENVVLVPRGSLRLILLEYHKYILRRLHYALPPEWRVFKARRSTQLPLADIPFVSPESAPVAVEGIEIPINLPDNAPTAEESYP